MFLSHCSIIIIIIIPRTHSNHFVPNMYPCVENLRRITISLYRRLTISRLKRCEEGRWVLLANIGKGGFFMLQIFLVANMLLANISSCKYWWLCFFAPNIGDFHKYAPLLYITMVLIKEMHGKLGDLTKDHFQNPAKIPTAPNNLGWRGDELLLQGKVETGEISLWFGLTLHKMGFWWFGAIRRLLKQ